LVHPCGLHPLPLLVSGGVRKPVGWNDAVFVQLSGHKPQFHFNNLRIFFKLHYWTPLMTRNCWKWGVGDGWSRSTMLCTMGRLLLGQMNLTGNLHKAASTESCLNQVALLTRRILGLGLGLLIPNCGSSLLFGWLNSVSPTLAIRKESFLY